MDPEVESKGNRFKAIIKIGAIMFICGFVAMFAGSFSDHNSNVHSVLSLVGTLGIWLGAALSAGGSIAALVYAGWMTAKVSRELYDAGKKAEAQGVTSRQLQALPESATQGNAGEDGKTKANAARVEIRPAKTLSDVHPPLKFTVIFVAFPVLVVILMSSESNEVSVGPLHYFVVLMFLAIGLVLCVMSVASLAYGRQKYAGKSDLELAQIEYHDIEIEEAAARIAVDEAESSANLIAAASEEGSALQKVHSLEEHQRLVFAERQRLAKILERKEESAAHIIKLGGTPQGSNLLAMNPKAAQEAFENEKPGWVYLLERKLLAVVVVIFAAEFLGAILLYMNTTL